MHVNVDAVTRLVETIARDIVLPKFKTLRDDEIHHKPTTGHLDDIVTDVDREAESLLSRELVALVPSAAVLGEEAAHNDPGLLDLLSGSRPVWIVDPLDGTSNFASGNDGFGIMVGLAVEGRVRYAWISLPARSELFVAQSGSGAYCNGSRVRTPPANSATPRAALFVRYMPPELRARVLAATSGRLIATGHSGAAAVEYTDIARGRKDCAIYYRLLPWDHGAPALVLCESGGTVEHLDGQPYTVRSASQITLVARDAAMAGRLREWIREGER